MPEGRAPLETSADNLTAVLRQVSEGSTCEIENLIGELQALRKELYSDSNRMKDKTGELHLIDQVCSQEILPP